MKTLVSIAIVALLALICAPAIAQSSVEELRNPRDRGQWVSDEADILGGAAITQLNSMIQNIYREQGVEIAVVTVNLVDTATPKEFATELFNHWQIGDASRDNGLLVLMVVGERRLEMETGYGTEIILTDAWLKAMQEDRMVPRFKEGNYSAGLVDGVAASIERLRTYPDGIPPGSSPDPYDDGELPVPWWLMLSGGLAGLGGSGAWWKHRRDRTCPTCGERMTMLSEEEDDAKLTEGEQTEEALGSVDYQFWYCSDDEFSRLLRVQKWFSGYSTCRKCSHRTMSVSTRTISSPTYTSTGQEEVEEHCAHCSYHHVSYRTLPRKTRSTSSSSGGGYSSGGGSSFGGGSSGGGGAGSSW